DGIGGGGGGVGSELPDRWLRLQAWQASRLRVAHRVRAVTRVQAISAVAIQAPPPRRWRARNPALAVRSFQRAPNTALKGGIIVYRFACRLAYVACLAMTASPAAAQLQWPGTAEVAQAAVPRRAVPIPNKPVSEEEAAKAARINNWTVGVAGGLLEGTFIRYAADLGKALDDGENMRVLPIVSYGAVGNVSDLIYLKGVDIAITYSDVLDHFK